MALIAFSALALWSAIWLVTRRVWVGAVLTAWALSACYLSSSLVDLGSLARHMQSFSGHGVVSWVSEGFRYLSHAVQARSFMVAFETRLLIGMGLVVTAALYARRPLAS